MEADTRRMVRYYVLFVGSSRLTLVSAGAFLEFHDPLAAWMHSYGADPHVIDTLIHSSDLGHAYVRLDVSYEKP